MRKIIAMVITVLLSLSLVGCGNSGTTTASSSSDVSKEPLSKTEFQKMLPDPEKYKGSAVDFPAQVFVAPERDDDYTYLQVYADPESYEYNMVIYVPDPHLDVKEGDFVRIIGTVKGKFEGANAFGAELTSPAISASKVIVTDYASAFSPAVKTLDLNLVQDQSGYSLTLNKIEFAANETRVHFTVTNNTKDEISFYSSNAVLLQNDKQYDEQDNYTAEYKEPQSDIKPGITSQGLVAYPAVDMDAGSLRVMVEGYTNDWDIDLQPFIFDVTW